MTSTASAVIFDLDGVLVDSEVIAIELEVAALADLGVPITADALAERYVGVSAATMTTALIEEFGVALTDEWWDAMRQRSHAALTQHLMPVPGMPALLESLKNPACIASGSSHERIELSLMAAGLIRFFPDGTRFSAADVQHGKPAPDLFLHAAATSEWDPAGCVVVEDSPFGVRAALAAGMGVIGFVGGSHCGPAWAQRLRQAGAPVVAEDAEVLAALLT